MGKSKVGRTPRPNDGRGQFVKLAGDQPRTQINAHSRRIDPATVQPGVDHGSRAAATKAGRPGPCTSRLVSSYELRLRQHRRLHEIEIANLGGENSTRGPRRGKPARGRTAPRPSSRDAQRRSGESPRGVTRPRPVMTTRRSKPSMNDSLHSAPRSPGPHPDQGAWVRVALYYDAWETSRETNSTQARKFPCFFRFRKTLTVRPGHASGLPEGGS